ncbi:MAG TPA: hypothetical protein VHE55_02625 [Fimbriimonadaceae bacterium]|nr:hypothetical protein [Fimbriimonadaceae bacterium]
MKRLAAFGLALAACPAYGQIHGRFSVIGTGGFSSSNSLDASLGYGDWAELATDLRLTWTSRRSNWDYQVHYDVLGDFGGGAILKRRRAKLLPIVSPPPLLDLTSHFSTADGAQASGTIDRLAVGYTTPKLVVRLGRQALSWGGGQLFHPMDIVNPFPPDVVDAEYKPGVDMAFAQWLFADGSDLQFVGVPRRSRIGGPVEAGASTAALHLSKGVGNLSTEWILAYDYGDWTAAARANGPWRGATWNFEALATGEKAGATKLSALANVEDALTLFRRNATIFAELYRNGFGVGSRGRSYDSLPSDLARRLARGQLFGLARDYFGFGGTLECTPLETLTGSLIVNLDDGGLYLALQEDRSLSDESDLLFGLQTPIARRGTEYGGLPTTGSGPPYDAVPATVFVQYRIHF